MRPLSEPYTVDVDMVSKGEWYKVIADFEDCNIYQTWSYEVMRSRPNKISHLLLRRDGTVVAAAQARILRVPVLGCGVAYIRWGPLWRRRDEPAQMETLRQALRAIHNEFAIRRRLLLRVYPVLFRDEDFDGFMSLFEDEGYQLRTDLLEGGRTLLVNLKPTLDEIRKGLDPKWRGHLNRAERNNLQIVEGQGDDTWTIFTGLYREMVQRKQFSDPIDPESFRAIQGDLPGAFKMKLMISFAEGRPAAGIICSALGNTAIYLFGASNEIGMKSSASYILQWQAITRMKALGLETYNLHGINPEKNPGTYSFKSGLCGKNGRDVRFIGRFDASRSALSRLTVYFGESARAAMVNLKGRLRA